MFPNRSRFDSCSHFDLSRETIVTVRKDEDDSRIKLYDRFSFFSPRIKYRGCLDRGNWRRENIHPTSSYFWTPSSGRKKMNRGRRRRKNPPLLHFRVFFFLFLRARIFVITRKKEGKICCIIFSRDNEAQTTTRPSSPVVSSAKILCV